MPETCEKIKRIGRRSGKSTEPHTRREAVYINGGIPVSARSPMGDPFLPLGLPTTRLRSAFPQEVNRERLP